jgi:hypothetical protein
MGVTRLGSPLPLSDVKSDDFDHAAFALIALAAAAFVAASASAIWGIFLRKLLVPQTDYQTAGFFGELGEESESVNIKGELLEYIITALDINAELLDSKRNLLVWAASFLAIEIVAIVVGSLLTVV